MFITVEIKDKSCIMILLRKPVQSCYIMMNVRVLIDILKDKIYVPDHFTL